MAETTIKETHSLISIRKLCPVYVPFCMCSVYICALYFHFSFVCYHVSLSVFSCLTLTILDLTVLSK